MKKVCNIDTQTIRENIAVILDICDKIDSDGSITAIAKRLEINEYKLYRFLEEFSGQILREKTNSINKLHDALTFEERVYQKVFECSTEYLDDVMPDDYKETFDYVFKRALTQREQKVIIAHHFDGLSYDEIGKQYGVTRERIRQIEAKAIRKLQNEKWNNILREGLKFIRFIQEFWHCDKIPKEDIEKKRTDNNFDRNTPICFLDLSVRSYNCLYRAKIDTIDDLLRIDEVSLYKIRNLGKKSVKEIVDKVHSLDLKMSWEE